MDFREYVRKAKAAFRPKMYRGCENCRHYIGRMCMRTQEELTVVCDEWEERRDDGKTQQKDRQMED